MSSFVVMNVRKQKGSGGALGNHIDRTVGKEHMYKNANPELKKKNFALNTGYDGTIMQRVDKCISENYKGKKAIRKDAVKYISLVLTGSHEQMKKIEKNKDGFKSWVADNLQFIDKEYQMKNLVKFDVHLDEKTPHIHAIIVPLTSDGRLSAKEMVGNRKQMKERLTRYADAMQKYGLERGIENSKATAKDVNQFYTMVNEAERVRNLDFKSVKSISPRDKTQLLEMALKGEKILDKVEEFNKGRTRTR